MFSLASNSFRRSNLHFSRLCAFSTSINSTEQVEQQYLVHTYTDTGVRAKEGLVIDRGEGVYLFDQAGKKYLDFGSGIAVNSLGYNDSGFKAAVIEQSKKLIHISNLFHTTPNLDTAKKLVNHSVFDKVFFCNSGTEANEAAFKFARLYAASNTGVTCSTHLCDSPDTPCRVVNGVCKCTPNRSKIRVLAFKGGFHGRSMGSLSMTFKPTIREPFMPFSGDITFIPFNDVKAVEREMADDVSMVIVEPVQGEGGVNPATIDFFQAIREKCDKHNALMHVDEVQSGLGRTGTLWAHESYNIKPDMMSLAKPLAGGIPIGALLVKDKVASIVKPGLHGTTFGGNPLACHVAGYVLDRITSPSFLENVRDVGTHLGDRIWDLAKEFPNMITTVRQPLGKGLFIGVQLSENPEKLVKKALENGLILITCGKNTLRISPPLILSKEEAEEGVAILKKSLQAIEG